MQQAVIAFQHQYPSIDIEFRLDDRMQDLVAEGFDLGFRTGKPKDSSLIARKVAYKTNELEMLKNAALEGNMVSVLTAQTIGNEVLEGKLIPIMPHLPLADFGTFYVVYPHRDLPLKTRLFLEVLKTFISDELPLWEKRIPHFEGMYRRQRPG